jgi:peptidoglycan/xylan/chitin deacetylase (PgdA/CDA1 family)
MISPRKMGAVITAIIIAIGVALIYPVFILETKSPPKEQAVTLTPKEQAVMLTPKEQAVMLTFNIVNSSNMPRWCDELSSMLLEKHIHSTIFMTGAVADTYPSCVTSFSSDTDIGSSTYTYDNITSIPDYLAQLDSIKQGKKAIDRHGFMNSTLFRAPYGNVDGNIYSLLSRSQIIADFSYSDHYNLYTSGLSGKTFYTFPLVTLNNLSELKELDANPNTPLMINFYNNEPIRSIEDFLNSTSRFQYQFQSASELTKIDLTARSIAH